jgi:DNA-binding response OmpR family regulator
MPRVLIIEDDPATHMLMSVVLRRAGFECVVADDGARGLLELHGGGYDAVVLDLLLPKVNGFEILRDVKCTAPELLPRIVVCSAASQATLRDWDDLRLASAFIQKPLDIDEFRDAVLAAAQTPKLRLVRQAAG